MAPRMRKVQRQVMYIRSEILLEKDCRVLIRYSRDPDIYFSSKLALLCAETGAEIDGAPLACLPHSPAVVELEWGCTAQLACE